MGHYVITLVHGTFAPGARWTRRGSRLRQELTSELEAEGHTVSFSSPVWSGRNGHEDRRRGSLKLRRCLVRQMLHSPGARHYVIAHSHGGNVALRAIRMSPNLRNRVAGLVTIATPFLLFKRESGRLIFFSKFVSIMRREFFSVLRGLFMLLLAVPLLPLLMAVEFTEGRPMWKRFVYGAGMLGGYAGLFAAGARWALPWAQTHFPWAFEGPFWFWFTVGGLSLVTGGITLFIYEDARREAFKLLARELVGLRRGLFRRYSYAQPQSEFGAQVRLLVLSSGIDEAQAALSGAWWLHLVSSLWAAFVSVLMLAVAALGLAALVYGNVQLYQYLGIHPMFGKVAEQVIGLVVLLGAILMTLVLSLVAGVVSGVTARSSPGLGFTTRRANLLLSVQAQRQPGSGLAHEYQRFGALQLLRDAQGGLFHSRVYSSPCALKVIAGWMIGRVLALPQGQPRTAAQPGVHQTAHSGT